MAESREGMKCAAELDVGDVYSFVSLHTRLDLVLSSPNAESCDGATFIEYVALAKIEERLMVVYHFVCGTEKIEVL